MPSQTDLNIRVALQDVASSGLVKLGGILATVFAVDKIKQFAEESIRAASSQQLAEYKLAAMLENVKGAREGDFEALKKQSSALQELTTYADEEIINAQAMLATDQLRGDQIQKLIPGIMDMASANSALGQTNGDLTATAEAVGKSFTVGAGALSRQNLVMSEAEKKAFDLADKEGKLNILTKALADNFGGAAKAAAETYEGRMKRVTNQIDELKEKVGAALIPTIDYLSQMFLQNLNVVNGTDIGYQELGKAIFSTVNFFIGLTKAAKLVMLSVFDFGNSLINVAKLVFAFGEDVFGTFSSLSHLLVPILKALAQAAQGNFKEAWDEIKKSVDLSFSHSKKVLSEMSDDQKTFGIAYADTWASIGESALAAIDQKGYKPMQVSAVKAYSKMTPGKEISKGNEELQKSLSDLADKYSDLETKGSQALRELEDEHRDKLRSIQEEINKTQESIAELTKSYNQERQTDLQKIAGKVVDTEQNIASMQKQLLSETNAEKAAELRTQIAKEQKALQDNAGFISTISGAVTEARRRASLTDLQREIEDYNQRRSLAEQEYQEKLGRLQGELAAFQQNQISEMSLYEFKKNKIQDMMIEATANYISIIESQFQVTKQKIEAEIDLYNRLAAAIAAVRGGTISTVLSYTPPSQSNVNYNNLNLNVNTNLNNAQSSKDLATQISSAIMNQLKLNMKLP